MLTRAHMIINAFAVYDNTLVLHIILEAAFLICNLFPDRKRMVHGY